MGGGPCLPYHEDRKSFFLCYTQCAEMTPTFCDKMQFLLLCIQIDNFSYCLCLASMSLCCFINVFGVLICVKRFLEHLVYSEPFGVMLYCLSSCPVVLP